MLDLLSLLFLISHGANAIIAFALIVSSLRLYRATKITLVLLMVILMGSWAVTNTLLVVPLLFGLTKGHTIVNLIASWNIIGSAIVPAVFIIFVDAFEGEIDTKKVSIAVATIVACIFISLMGLVSGDITLSSTIVQVGDLPTMRWSPISSLAIFPTVIACGIWTQIDLKLSKEHAIDERQLRQIDFMRLGGVFMFFIGPAFGIAGVIAVDGFNANVLGTYLSEIIGYLFVSVGIFMITIAYTTSDAVAFLQPQRMDSIIAIFSTGIPVLQYDFSPQEEQKPDVSLISGAITAITAIMSEAFNVQSDVRQIAFYDKELILNFQPIGNETNIAFVLITDRRSDYLEGALERFSKNFIDILPENAVDGVQLSDNERNNAINLLLRSFGLSSIDEKLG